MKSARLKEKERQKRSTLFAIIGISFIFLILVMLLAFAFTGNNASGMGQIADVIMYHLKEIWGDIWFKISNFLDFIKRGAAS